jgi:hypothetical protein
MNTMGYWLPALDTNCRLQVSTSGGRKGWPTVWKSTYHDHTEYYPTSSGNTAGCAPCGHIQTCQHSILIGYRRDKPHSHIFYHPVVLKVWCTAQTTPRASNSVTPSCDCSVQLAYEIALAPVPIEHPNPPLTCQSPAQTHHRSVEKQGGQLS